MVGIHLQFSVSIHNPRRRPLKERLRLTSEGKGWGWIHPIMDYKGKTIRLENCRLIDIKIAFQISPTLTDAPNGSFIQVF